MSKLAALGGTRAVPEGMIAPWPWITEEDKKAVMEALDEVRGWRYPAPNVAALEKEWSQYTGMEYALAANSGTAALHMAVAAAGIGPGDEVLVPAFTFLASASCVLHSNGIPIFVDIDPKTATIDPARLEERITDRTKAIIAVDIHGLPADYDAIHAVAKKHNLTVIEDASQAQGAVYKGKKVGGLAELVGCSLNGSKNLSALSEGGLFTTSNQKYYELADRVRMFGEEVKPGEPRRYNAYMMGWNYRFDELEAAFTRSQLRRLDAMTALRQRNCEFLTDRISQLPGIETPYVPQDRTHSYFFYVIRVKPEKFGLDEPVARIRDGIQRALAAEGVPAGRWQTVTVPGQSLFQIRDGYGKGCPWSCPFARQDIRYNCDEYPEAQALVDEFLAIGHSFGGLGPPNDLKLMKYYAEAFEKVLTSPISELLELGDRED